MGKDVKLKDVRLTPFKVLDVQSEADEIPKGVQLIGAPSFWKKGYKGQDVVVAVLDTGCQTDHPDLQGRIIDGYNFTDDYNANALNYYDNNGHGTHVAGTIAANANGKGISGVAPESKLLVCKVLNGEGSGYYDWIIQGIQFAINWRGPNGERVRVINMSLGGPEDVREMHDAIIEAVLNDILVVVAAGNEGDDSEDTFEIAYPSSYNEVIEIGAVDFNKELAYFSNNNTELDCVAPGVDIKSTYIGSTYAVLDGTSMATPHVSGALALIINYTEKEFRRELTESELYAQLIKRTEEMPYLKSSVGNGLVKLDSYEKVKALIHFVTTNFS
jgi:major intracellular serine protease